MIVFVDYEHAEGRSAPWGEKLLAARTWITYRLEDLAEMPCVLVRYDRLTPELLARLDARAIFISGNATDPVRYSADDLAPMHEIIRSSRWPVFGFCGGFQCMADAFGAEVRLITQSPDAQQAESLRPFGEGKLGEAGYRPVELLGEHPLLAGIEPQPVVRHAHALEVPVPPEGFTTLASTPVTAVQMAVDDDRRMVGTQFHPEYYTDEHPAGRVMIENFLRWAEIVR